MMANPAVRRFCTSLLGSLAASSAPRPNSMTSSAFSWKVSEYHIILLEVYLRLQFKDILKKFDKRFGTSAPDFTHELN